MSYVTDQAFFLDDAAEHLETAVLPPREQRRAHEALEVEKQRWVEVASEHYAQTEKAFEVEVEFAERISTEGKDVLADEVLAPMRSGELAPKEAAKRVAEMRADLNRARAALKAASEREESTWSEVSASPAEYQRALARRSPLLFQGGRGLVHLPVVQD